MKSRDYRNLAEIEYHGQAGITRPSLDAIVRILQFGDVINSAKLISHTKTNHRRHGFILTVNGYYKIAIKCGFGSGYSGEGPRGLSTALKLLDRHASEIDEFEVAEEFVDRLDYNCLTQSDLDFLNDANTIRGARWTDYLIGDDASDHARLNRFFPSIIPYKIIDPRIMDLALDFPSNQDAAIVSAYRRLEDIVRKRTGIQGSGQKLFSKAFMDDDSPLHWNDDDKSEQKAKAQLFTAIYGGFRNPRVHREFDCKPTEYIREFLLINELYILERNSVERSSK